MTDARILDVRAEPPMRRHTLIFATYEALEPGAAFVLVNDHDPKPLYYQFAAEKAGEFKLGLRRAGAGGMARPHRPHIHRRGGWVRVMTAIVAHPTPTSQPAFPDKAERTSAWAACGLDPESADDGRCRDIIPELIVELL